MKKINDDGHNAKTQILVKANSSSDNDKKNVEKQLIFEPNIGLTSDVRLPIVDMLNISLANEAVLSQKTRSAHWNGSGPGFLELYIFLETQYKQLNEIVDKVAERTRMLGGAALGSLNEFLEQTRLDDRAAEIPSVLNLLADHEAVIRFLRDDIRKCSEYYEDDATVDLLISVMSLHEKMAWMLRSYIDTKPATAKARNEKDNGKE